MGLSTVLRISPVTIVTHACPFAYPVCAHVNGSGVMGVGHRECWNIVTNVSVLLSKESLCSRC